MLIGETWTSDVSELKDYYGTNHEELQMPMDLMFTKLKPLSADVFRKHVGAVDASGEWPVWVMSNHDIVRAYTRFADGKHDDDIAKLLAGMYLTLRGTPIMYYGEEIGMKNNDPTRKEDVKDPIGRLGWPEEKGRDGERTPMQWNDTPNAGFTTGIPWLPVPVSYQTHNVATEKADPNSILNFYKNLLAIAAHQQSAARRRLRRAQPERCQRILVPAALQRPGCAGGAEYVGESAERELRPFETRIRRRSRRRRYLATTKAVQAHKYCRGFRWRRTRCTSGKLVSSSRTEFDRSQRFSETMKC